jgi:predicted Zn-dependent protease
MPAILLIPLGDVHPRRLHELAADLRAHGHRVEEGAALAIEAAWRHPESGLVASQQVVHALMDRAVPERWQLAMTEEGLCGGEAGPVFGEAALGGCCAVIAVQPLCAGSGAVAEVLRERILTGALHELGHLAGAGHCRRASCVMYPSRNIADSDRKGTSYCQDCRRVVQSAGKRKT